ncbi:MAG: carbonic anhydrase family protein, partial [Verrucomicrobiota bacterium]
TGAGETVESGQMIEANELLPDRPTVYHYPGSLTTPPGTEGVRWFVFREPSRMSGAQIRKFSKMFPNNFRPVQELNGRKITLLHATRGDD